MVDISKLKFRHLYGELYKKKFESISPSTSSTESCGIKGNPLYFAFSWKTNGGGALAVLRNTEFQKFQKIPPLITGHQGQILDFDFCPFNDHQIATSSEDCTVKLWKIPEESFTEDITTPISTLSGHQKKVSLIAFNHISSNVLASASADQTVKIWNLEKQTENINIPIPDHAWSLQWNLTGNLLGLINKDKQWRIMDPRAKTLVCATKAHTGPKNQKFTWIGEQYCLTTGLSRSFERQFYLYDTRNTEKPIQTQILDNSSGTLYPFFDNDTNILFLAGKGDANIRFYEFSENQLFFCSNFTTTKSGTGYGFYTKRSVDVSIHEIMRGLKLTDTTAEFIKFCAPRKADTFQDDLFPNTIGHIPAQLADDFFANKNAPAILVSLNPNTLDATTQSNLAPQQFSHIADESTVFQQSQDLGSNFAIQQKLQNEKLYNQELKKKNQLQQQSIEQLEIALNNQTKGTQSQNKEDAELQQKFKREKQKNLDLQQQLKVLQEKVTALEKSVNQNTDNNNNAGAGLNQFRQSELDFLQKLQQLTKEREQTLKQQMK